MNGPERDASSRPLDRAELQIRASRGAFWTLIHIGLSMPAAFIANLVVARALGVEQYGKLAVLTASLEVAGGVAGIGLTQGVIQFAVKRHAVGDIAGVQSILSKSQSVRLVVVAPLMTALLFLIVDLPLPYLLTASLFGIWVPSLLEGVRTALTIENQTDVAAKTALVSSLVANLGVVAAAWAVPTAASVWLVRGVLSVLPVVLPWWFIRPEYRRATLSAKFPRQLPSGFWRFTLLTGLAGVISGLLLSRSEVFVLQALSTPVEVGLFALVFGVVSHLFAPAGALVGPLIPALSGLREVDPEAVPSAFRRTLRTSATVSATLSVATVVPLALCFPSLYGEEYRGASGLVVGFGLGMMCAFIGGPISAFVLARLSARAMLTAVTLALVADLVVAALTIPRLGASGAVLANLTGALSYAAMLLRVEVREGSIRTTDVLRASKPLLVGAAVIGLGWVVSSSWGFTGFAAAAGAMLLSVVLVIVGLRVTRSGLSDADVNAVLRGLPQRVLPAVQWPLRFVAHDRGADLD